MSLLLSLALSMAGSGTVPPPLVLGKASHSEKASSRCQSNALPASPLWITCTYNELTLAGREVHWAQPLSTIERRGFALLFHGSDLFDYTWEAQLGADEYGLYYKVRTVQLLLDAGYTVIAPKAHFSGARDPLAWQSNDWKYADANLKRYANSDDAAVVDAVLAGIEDGTFGAGNDASEVHAVGFSSGGYMCSRLAFNWPGRFRSLSITAASYFYCAGAYCDNNVARDRNVASLFQEHPPTIFFSGGADTVVPMSTTSAYIATLKASGIPTDHHVIADAAHAWLWGSAQTIVAWIAEHSGSAVERGGARVAAATNTTSEYAAV